MRALGPCTAHTSKSPSTVLRLRHRVAESQNYARLHPPSGNFVLSPISSDVPRLARGIPRSSYQNLASGAHRTTIQREHELDTGRPGPKKWNSKAVLSLCRGRKEFRLLRISMSVTLPANLPISPPLLRRDGLCTWHSVSHRQRSLASFTSALRVPHIKPSSPFAHHPVSRQSFRSSRGQAVTVLKVQQHHKLLGPFSSAINQ